MNAFGGNSVGGNDASFFRQMGQKRVAARPAPPAPRPGLGAPPPTAGMRAPQMPAAPVRMPGNTPMPPPAGNAPRFETPAMNAPATGPNTPGLGAGADPGGMLFFGLPQGTEELFGAAPTGFNRTLRPGGKLGPNTSGGNFPGIF